MAQKGASAEPGPSDVIARFRRQPPVSAGVVRSLPISRFPGIMTHVLFGWNEINRTDPHLPPGTLELFHASAGLKERQIFLRIRENSKTAVVKHHLVVAVGIVNRNRIVKLAGRRRVL